MNKVRIKGLDITIPRFKDSFSRRAQSIENKICQTLSKIGVERDDVDVNMQGMPIKRLPANVRWYFDGLNLFFEHSAQKNYLENLFVVSKILEFEVENLLSGEINKEDFKHKFESDNDLDQKKIEARLTLGLADEENDLQVINKAYKDLAKKNHPDAGGDLEEFKKINSAHKLLIKELK